MAFCYQCGKPISEQAKFCPYCGYNLEPKKVVPAPEPEPEPEPAPKKGKKGKVEKAKKGKGKREEPETFDIEDDFTEKSQGTVAYTVEQKPAEPTPVHHAKPTPDNPLPSRDGETHVPSLTPEAPDEDRFGWVWIVVGVIILIIVLVVIWALLFSGYY